MRLFLLTCIALFSFNIASSQEKKPVIIGQKPLSVDQGKSITIQLTDLYVEEQQTGGDNQGGGKGGDDCLQPQAGNQQAIEQPAGKAGEDTRGHAAQRVQLSGFPAAYAQHEDYARALASALRGYSTAAFTCSINPIGGGLTATVSRDLVAAFGTNRPAR